MKESTWITLRPTMSKLLLPGMLLCLLIGLFTTLSPAPAFADAPGTRTICRPDRPLPPGLVIVAVSSTAFWDFRCGFPRQNNLFTIAPTPTTQSIVCWISPVPLGFVVTAQTLSSPNTPIFDCTPKTITPVGNAPITVCASSFPLPLDWITVAEYSINALPTSICQVDRAQTTPFSPLVEKTIAPAGTAPFLTVCASSAIPEHYVVADRNQNTAFCPLDQGHSLLLEQRKNI